MRFKDMRKQAFAVIFHFASGWCGFVKEWGHWDGRWRIILSSKTQWRLSGLVFSIQFSFAFQKYINNH
jgi:hypothetical protein